MVMPQRCVSNEFENARYFQPRLRIRLEEIMFFFETRPNEAENRMLSYRNRHVTQVSGSAEMGAYVALANALNACSLRPTKIAHARKSEIQIRYHK